MNKRILIKNPETVIVSFILSLVLCSSILGAYGFNYVSVMTPVIVSLCVLTYMFCIIASNHRLVGTICITTYIMVLIFIVRELMYYGQSDSEMYFWQWVLNKDDDVAMVVPYLFCLTIGSCAFIGFVVYYFSVELYRISFLTLVSLIPCVLYIKITAEIDNIYLVCIAAANLLIHILHSEAKYRGKVVRLGRKNAVAGGGIVIALVMLIASAIPKQQDAVFYETFEEIFMRGQEMGDLSGSYADRNEYSGNGDNYKNLSDARMYNIYGDTFTYFKRQTFDLYDYDNDRWYTLDDYDEDISDSDSWEDYANCLSLNKLSAAIKAACKNNSELVERYGLEELVAGDDIYDPLNRLFISANNFSASYYLTSSRATKVVISNGFGTMWDDYVVLKDGTFSRINGLHDSNINYSLCFYGNESAVRAMENMGGADYNTTDSIKMLQDCYMALDNQKNLENGAEDDNQKCLGAFIKQAEYAEAYASETGSSFNDIPESIVSLSNDICRNCSYDYEKAAAIEDYFHSGEFTYDLEFKAENNSPEYFLFNSKTGTCSDYASAYVLLARAAGLTVRYVEGYVPTYSSATDEAMYVTESSSHAYPEVFIQNVGWIVYEPTVASAADEDTGFDFVEFLKSLKMDYGLMGIIVAFIALIAFLLIIIKLIIPALIETGFRISLCISSKEKVIKRSFERLARNRRWMTPGELADYMTHNGKNIDDLALLYELLKYKDAEMDSKSYNGISKARIIRSYVRAYRASSKPDAGIFSFGNSSYREADSNMYVDKRRCHEEEKNKLGD